MVFYYIVSSSSQHKDIIYSHRYSLIFLNVIYFSCKIILYFRLAHQFILALRFKIKDTLKKNSITLATEIVKQKI